MPTTFRAAKVTMLSAYLINLDERIDRLERSRLALAHLPISLQRLSAVNAREIAAALASAHPLVTPGVAACWLSHQQAFRIFLQSQSQFAVIFEDDVIPRRRLNGLLEALCRNPNAPFDVLQLGYLPGTFVDKLRRTIDLSTSQLWTAIASLTCRIPPLERHVGHRLRVREGMARRELKHLGISVVPSSFAAGTHAYVISRVAAAALLKVNDPVFLAADDCLSALAHMRSLRIMRLARSAALQSDLGDSDIGNARFSAGHLGDLA